MLSVAFNEMYTFWIVDVHVTSTMKDMSVTELLLDTVLNCSKETVKTKRAFYKTSFLINFEKP